MTPAPSVELRFPSQFLDFTRLCEVYCVAGCCGLEAFSFDDETLGSAIEKLGVVKALHACESAMDFAESCRSEKARCWSDQDVFNNYWDNGEGLYRWTKKIVQSIRAQIQKRTEQGEDTNPPPLRS